MPTPCDPSEKISIWCSFSRAIAILIWVFIGMLVGIGYMSTQPVRLIRVPLPEKGKEHGVLYHFVGRQYSSKNVQSLEGDFTQDPAFLMELKEEDLNSWMKFNVIPFAKRSILGFKPELPNFMIREGRMCVTIDIRNELLSFVQPLVIRYEGEIKKRGNAFKFVPDTIFVGAARIPFIKFLGLEFDPSQLGFVKEKDVAQKILDAWNHLSAASLDDDELVLERR